MSLSREEVLKIAKLSRLEFKEEEIENYRTSLNTILKYVDELAEVNTDNVEPLTQINSQVTALRDDVVKTSLSQEESMKNSPAKVDGMLIVPKVVGGEE